MAKKDYVAELEEEKRRSLVRIGIASGVLVAFILLYCLLLAVGVLDSGNVSIMQGASLVAAVACCSVIGANFNSWSKANKAMGEYNLRMQMKKKKRK